MDLTVNHAHRFVKLAVLKGYITSSQEKEVLSEFMFNYFSARLKPQRLVGEILLKKGWMTFDQVLNVLEELPKNQEQREQHKLSIK